MFTISCYLFFSFSLEIDIYRFYKEKHFIWMET